MFSEFQDFFPRAADFIRSLPLEHFDVGYQYFLAKYMPSFFEDFLFTANCFLWL